MKPHALHAAIGAMWGALVFALMLLLRNAIGDPQALGDQSIMLVSLIVIGAVALPVGRARRLAAVQKRAVDQQRQHHAN
ncbi:hypothetical protein [Zhihengliuella halotolerans]|uniref:Uncharacterized protein n=1 Tax=Zhihengliuella halotolerans TaxID=370736 RepID=A0A4Q8AG17_9MICC|nr:hypothetical protein [Zhihengliuella halotolerans]RZU62685.1 hypothetical protein EV380_2287 [Zhihengliuella halotolerans]